MEPEAPPRFLVDGMAVRLGKYLRCLGYDAVWDVRETTPRLARRAALEGRVLLTRNTRAGLEFTPPPRWLRLASEDAVEGLRQVVAELGLEVGARLFTRCIRCNVPLEELPAEAARGRVPRSVHERQRRFWTCPRCGTVFWWGSHVVNTCRKLGIEPPGGAGPPPAGAPEP